MIICKRPAPPDQTNNNRGDGGEVTRLTGVIRGEGTEGGEEGKGEGFEGSTKGSTRGPRGP